MMRKRFRLLGVLALVLALVMPSSAFAWDWLADGCFWRGNTSQGMYGACVHTDNKYDAAAWLFSSGDPAMLSSEVRTKLSDPNYGGRFYEYAQTFSHMEDLTQYPEWLPAYVGVANLFVNGFVLGITNVGFYTSNVSESLYSGAKIDFERVLAGEDLSGGGSGGTPDTNIPSTLTFGHADYVGAARYDGWFTNTSYNSKVGDLLVGGTIDISAIRNTISTYASSYPYVTYLIKNSSNGGFYNNCKVYLNLTVWFSSSAPTVSAGNTIIFPSGSRPSNAVSLSPRVTQNSDSLQLVASGAVFNVGVANSSSYTEQLGSIVCYYLGNYISTAPAPPDGDWPEEEEPTVVTPDPPEVPTPTAPVATTEPSVSGPSVVWPEITINVEPTPEGLDYTELLRAINNNLNSLRSDLNQEFDSVISSLRNIYQYLQHLDSMLERHCKHIRDSIEDNVYELELWLKSLFEWLPEQLDYDAELNFDDSELRYLLRRILNKIPGGSNTAPTTYKPNPQADEPGFFDWLLDLWHRFLIDLVSVLPDELGGLVDAFSQLTHYFPFSIPWDLFALLLLFEHEPVTPVFQIPWGFGGGDGQTQMITIDLSVWDGVMAMVRPVFLVGFCFKLALITKDLLAGFDLNKGGV